VGAEGPALTLAAGRAADPREPDSSLGGRSRLSDPSLKSAPVGARCGRWLRHVEGCSGPGTRPATLPCTITIEAAGDRPDPAYPPRPGAPPWPGPRPPRDCPLVRDRVVGAPSVGRACERARVVRRECGRPRSTRPAPWWPGLNVARSRVRAGPAALTRTVCDAANPRFTGDPGGIGYLPYSRASECSRELAGVRPGARVPEEFAHASRGRFFNFGNFNVSCLSSHVLEQTPSPRRRRRRVALGRPVLTA
jgi:hypothetical protein